MRTTWRKPSMAARPCLISMISKRRMSLVSMRPSGSYTPSGRVTPMSPSANMEAPTARVGALRAGAWNAVVCMARAAIMTTTASKRVGRTQLGLRERRRPGEQLISKEAMALQAISSNRMDLRHLPTPLLLIAATPAMVRARRATASSRCRTAQIISRSRAERPFFIFVVGKVQA